MNRIKELRNAKGINQQVLADILNVQRPAISKYENGEVPLTDDTIRILAEYFDCSSDYLLGRTDTQGTKKDGSEEPLKLSDIEFALFGEVRELDDEDKAELLRDAQRMRELKTLREKSDGK